MTSKKVHLIIIDPQVDFCDPQGALYVRGADKSAERVGGLISKHRREIEEIHVTMDSHFLVHVAHPIFWVDRNGNHPDPYTQITEEQVRDRYWVPTESKWYARALEYTKALRVNNRYTLTIWPPHCRIGYPGHNIHPAVREGLNTWESDQCWPNVVTKGSFVFTEHYSAIQADVPDPSALETQPNTKLLEVVKTADIAFLMGWASSHCLASTGRDACDLLRDPKTASDIFAKKLVWLKDGSDPVPGYEHLAESFERELTGRGMRVASIKDFADYIQ